MTFIGHPEDVQSPKDVFWIPSRHFLDMYAMWDMGHNVLSQLITHILKKNLQKFIHIPRQKIIICNKS